MQLVYFSTLVNLNSSPVSLFNVTELSIIVRVSPCCFTISCFKHTQSILLFIFFQGLLIMYTIIILLLNNVFYLSIYNVITDSSKEHTVDIVSWLLNLIFLLGRWLRPCKMLMLEYHLTLTCVTKKINHTNCVSLVRKSKS